MESPLQNHYHHYFPAALSKAAVAGCASLALLGPVVGGAVASARLIPKTVEYAPGLSADVSLRTGQDSATIATGALGALHIPGIGYDLPVVGNVSPYVQVNEVSLKLDAGADTFAQYSFLAKDYQDKVIEPTKDAIRDRLLAGAAAGAAVDIIAVGGFIMYRRSQKKKTEQSEAVRQLAELPTDDPELSEKIANVLATSPERTADRSASGRKVWVAGAIAGTLLTACALDTIPVSRIGGAPATIEAPLSPSIIKRIPFLEGTTVSGIGGDAINTGVDRIEKEVVKTDAMWNRAVANLNEAFYTYTGGERLGYIDDRDIVAVMHISDVHCNYAYMQKIFDQLARKFQVQVILNTGDTYLTTGSLPFESDCLPELLEQIHPDNQNGRKVVMMYFRGNHDPLELSEDLTDRTVIDADGNEFTQLIVLDEDRGYTATEAGITFVGAPDPTSSGLEGTVPSDHHEKTELFQELGTRIADTACGAKQETGIPPIVAAHHPQALYETLARGCGDVYGGHTHSTTGPTAYRTYLGDVVHERILGSSGGAPTGKRTGITITQYAIPTTDAVSSIELVNARTGKVENSILVSVSPDGTVTIEDRLPPEQAIPVAENPDIAIYTPDKLTGMPF